MNSGGAMDIIEQRQGSRWVRIESAAEMTGLKLSRLRNLVHRHEVPYHKVGRSLLFDVQELGIWMERQKVVTVSEALDQRRAAGEAPREFGSHAKGTDNE